jgi:hypothetical protein
MKAAMKRHDGGPDGAAARQAKKDEPLPEKKSVKVTLDTPAHAMATYIDAVRHRDWKAALSVIAPDSRVFEVARIASNASQEGTGDWMDKARAGPEV